MKATVSCNTRGPKPRVLSERFWEKVDKGDGCWTWQRYCDRAGYGRIQARKDGRRTALLAHRLSWEMAFGDIPAGLCVLHRCDNRKCVRPEHLFLGSRRDNSDDMVAKGRQAVGRRLPNAVLTETVVAEARRRARAGELFVTLANEYGVGPRTMAACIRGRTWTHVQEPTFSGKNVRRGEASPHSRLTAVDVQAIRARIAEGHHRDAVGATFGISGRYVADIARRKVWGVVP